MLATLKNEFRLKQLGYRDCNVDQFYKTQWSKSRVIYWTIRIIFLLYWMSWLIVSLCILEDISDWWMMLTNWGVITLLLYFLVSFAVVTYGLFFDQNTANKKASNLGTISGNTKLEIDEEKNNSNNTLTTSNKSDLRWFHILNWILFELSCSLAIIITISYFSFLNIRFNPISINTHLINSVIMIFDLFFNAIPVRIMHFYHILLFSALYSVFTFILYATGFEKAIYPILDWENNFTFAISITVLITFLVGPLIHILITFLLYRLKIFFLEKCSSFPSSSHTARSKREFSVTKEILQENQYPSALV